MTKENTPTDENNGEARRLGTWLKEACEIATQVGCIEAVEPVLQMLKKIARDSINITIIGSPNSGKSSLINQILQKKLLPVSAITSNTQFCIYGDIHRKEEGFLHTYDQEWHSLEELQANNVFSESNRGRLVNIYLCHQWLTENSFCIKEKLPLDLSDEEIQDEINSLLEETDCVVLIIDALMPWKRSEAQFLSECVRRGIPVVIGLSKMDKLLEEEQEEIITYVTKHVNSYSPAIKVIPNSVNSSDNASISELKMAIEESIDQADILAIRTQQVTYTMLEVLGVICSAAQTGLEMESKNELDRNIQLKRRQQAIDSQNLVWEKIKQEFDLKRHKVDNLLREHLQNNQINILEVLMYELKRCNDVKTWWERDLPFRLERELRHLAGELSKTINEQIASDLQWLQQEVSREFKYSLQAFNEPNVLMNALSLEQQEVPLSNTNTLKIVSRVATAVSIILVGTLSAPLAFAGAGLAASVIAGLTAEQILHWNTTQEREKIREELIKVIERTEHKYALEVSHQLKENYDKVISDLKEPQLRWQQAQLQALIAIQRKSVSNSQVNWERLVQKSQQLIVEIKMVLNL